MKKKKPIKENEVIVPVIWLESLQYIAEEAKKIMEEDDGQPWKFRMAMSHLIGYASSAEIIIKYGK